MTDTPLVERRQEDRRRVLKSARIMINNTSIISCIVRNISAHGSRLAIDSIVGLPNEFMLDVFGEQPRRARVAWMKMSEVGVALD